MQKIRFTVLVVFICLVSTKTFASFSSALADYKVAPSFKSIGPHETMYTFRAVDLKDRKAISAYEACLLSYLNLIIEEFDWKIDKNILDEWQDKKHFPYVNDLDEYERVEKFAGYMDWLLPKLEMPIMGNVRSFFSLIWPSIDLAHNITEIEKECPLAAEYTRFLFKKGEAPKIDTIKGQIFCKLSGCLSACELLTLFALHTFGHGHMQDFKLAEKEAKMLAHSLGLHSPSMILRMFKTIQNGEGERRIHNTK